MSLYAIKILLIELKAIIGNWYEEMNKKTHLNICWAKFNGLLRVLETSSVISQEQIDVSPIGIKNRVL